MKNKDSHMPNLVTTAFMTQIGLVFNIIKRINYVSNVGIHQRKTAKTRQDKSLSPKNMLQVFSVMRQRSRFLIIGEEEKF